MGKQKLVPGAWPYTNRHSLLFSGQPGHTPGVIPVGDINVGLLVDMASVRGAEKPGRNIARLELIVGPLLLLGIIANKSHWSVIAV
jgi:hypothetical protein